MLFQTLSNHTHSVWAIDANPRFLISGSADRIIRVWHKESLGESAFFWKEQCHLEDHSTGEPIKFDISNVKRNLIGCLDFQASEMSWYQRNVLTLAFLETCLASFESGIWKTSVFCTRFRRLRARVGLDIPEQWSLWASVRRSDFWPWPSETTAFPCIQPPICRAESGPTGWFS